MSANAMVLADLQKGLVIGTDNTTCARYGTNNISDCIYQLRNRGHDIITVPIVVNHRGKNKKVALYRMATKDD